VIPALKERAVEATRGRALREGLVPRRAYAHYFIEAEGLHSRIHLQNFWSTFWPQLAEPATAHIHAFGPSGTPLGSVDREVPRFGSMFVEIRDLLRELGAADTEGIVAIDLEPPDEVRAQLTNLPNPLSVEVNTPYWMAYYDDAENYMYVHSIEKLGGTVFGTTRTVSWMLTRPVDDRERWRSWRLLDLDALSEVQIVAINHGTRPGTSTVGLYSAADDAPIAEQELEFRPRELHRVRFGPDELAAGAASGGKHARVGLDPLLTGNGKPYVLLRYGDGPLSLHHG
jgi:hypothetical protein